MGLKSFAVFLIIYSVQIGTIQGQGQDQLSQYQHSYPTLKLVGDNGKWRNKKPTNYLQKKFRNLEKEKQEEYKKLKMLKKKSEEKKEFESTIKLNKTAVDQVFLKDEKWQICQSLSEDSVKDTLIKFGVVTHIIPDVAKFRTSMKSLRDSIPRSKKKSNKKKEKKLDRQMDQPVKLSQSNYLGRSFGSVIIPPQSEEIGIYESGNMLDPGSEDLSREKRSIHKQTKGKKYNRRGKGTYLEAMMKDSRRKGTSRNFDQVPECYGWRYLSAISALTTDHAPDISVLCQSVSDMFNLYFAQTIYNILKECGLDTNKGLCPPDDGGTVKEICSLQCDADTDCGYQELCCRQGCSNKCVSVQGGNAAKRCDLGDQYMQCVYNRIDSQLCETGR